VPSPSETLVCLRQSSQHLRAGLIKFRRYATVVERSYGDGIYRYHLREHSWAATSAKRLLLARQVRSNDIHERDSHII
jgi:hypothetical protein